MSVSTRPDALTRVAVPPRVQVTTAVPTVGFADRLETIHDFWGFPDELYTLRYPATGCREAAEEVVEHKRQMFLRRELDWVRRGPKARTQLLARTDGIVFSRRPNGRLAWPGMVLYRLAGAKLLAHRKGMSGLDD